MTGTAKGRIEGSPIQRVGETCVLENSNSLTLANRREYFVLHCVSVHILGSAKEQRVEERCMLLSSLAENVHVLLYWAAAYYFL